MAGPRRQPLVGDSPGIESFRKVAERSGILSVAEETGAELVEFTETVEVGGKGTFRRFEMARDYAVPVIPEPSIPALRVCWSSSWDQPSA